LSVSVFSYRLFVDIHFHLLISLSNSSSSNLFAFPTTRIVNIDENDLNPLKVYNLMMIKMMIMMMMILTLLMMMMMMINLFLQPCGACNEWLKKITSL